MPYKNIVYIKLHLDLRDHPTFTDESDDDLKFIYFFAMLTAGITKNKIPPDGKYIKRVWNLEMKEEKIAECLKKLADLWPKFLFSDGFYRFRNFYEIHNLSARRRDNLGNSPELPLETPNINKTIYKIDNTKLNIKDFNNKDSVLDLNKEKSIKVKEAQLIMEYWNNHPKKIHNINELSGKRTKLLNGRLKSKHFQDNWKKAIDIMFNSEFCQGKNDRKWKASFDWFIANDNNFIKALEGKYNKQEGSKKYDAATERGRKRSIEKRHT